MHRTLIPLRFVVALACLASAFMLSISYGDRGVQFTLRSGKVAQANTGDPAAAKDDYNLSALRILNRVLLQLKDNYVEPERIKPNKMLVKALEEIQNAIPQIVISYDLTAKQEVPDEITVSVDERSKKFRVGDIQSLWEMSFKLKDIFTFIQANMKAGPDVKYADIEYAAINGMLSTLDPHSTLLPPKNYEDMQTQTGGKFGGLGIVISIREGVLTVMSPIPDTPAAKQGIRARDKIVRIGEESTVNMNIRDAVELMRGEPGTKVTLWVMRKGWEAPRRFDVERAIIKIASVDSQALADKIGYVRIKNFQANTFADLKKQMGDMKKKMGGMQGLIIDMRDNPGGLLQQAIRISDLFIDQGALVSTVGQGNKLKKKQMALPANTEPMYPIVVLVNPGSASASEIVSGALQNNDRAIVLGDTTFGKGSVQVIYEFPDKSALKLTIAQYLTPGDVSIQGRGIVPDLKTIPVTLKKGDADMFASSNIFREGDLDAALTNAATRKNDRPQEFIRYYEQPKTGKKDDFEDTEKFKEDFEIRTAQRLLVAAGKTWKRQELLKIIHPELERLRAKEMDAITGELKKLGVDWSAGANPKKPSYKLEIKTSAPNDTVKAGEKVSITATLTNTGSAPLHRLKAITDSDNPFLSDREFLFGAVAPGKSASWTIELKVPQDTSTRHDFIKFAVSDDAQAFGDADGVALKMIEQDRPHFAFNYEVLDPNGDGVFQAGEDIKLRLFVKNTGKAASAETLVYLKNLSRDAIFLERGRDKIKSIPPGEVKTLDFTFKAKKAPKDGKFELELDVYDATFREFTQRKFTVPFGAKDATITAASGVATTRGDAILRGAADAGSGEVAHVTKGATLPVIGKLGEWVKVKLPTRSAWVRASEVTLGGGTLAQPSGVKQEVFFQAPTILANAAQTMTSDKSVQLKLDLTDDSTLKDYYIFVYNRQNTTLNTKKVNYTRLNGSKTSATLTIPLFPGMNRIAISARDQDGMTATESAYVYRK